MESEELKEKIIFSVSQMGGAGNGSWLIEIALDESESVNLRKKAIFWAGQGGASMEEFARLYTSVSDREIKEQLIFAFSQSSSPDAADQLMDDRDEAAFIRYAPLYPFRHQLFQLFAGVLEISIRGTVGLRHCRQ